MEEPLSKGGWVFKSENILPELRAAFNRNGWPTSFGMSGRISGNDMPMAGRKRSTFIGSKGNERKNE
jgi:hypothetical protein